MLTLRVLVLALCLALIPSTVTASDHCQFVLGFKTLRDLIGHDIVGECLENEHLNANGDAVQQTTGGLLVWRKADNWTAFTDGHRTWINGPYGLQERLNWQRFPWEPDYAPGGVAATPTPVPAPIPPPPTATPLPHPTPTPRPFVDSALVQAYHVMRTTDEGNKVADMFVGLSASATFQDTSYWRAVPAEVAINREYRREDPRTLGLRLIWPTMWLKVYQEEGEVESFEECMALEAAIMTREVLYWSQMYGWKGKRNPAPERETWANDWVELYVDLGSDGYEILKWMWVLDWPRERCERNGEPNQYIDPDLLSAFRMARTGGDDEIGSRVLYALIDTGVDVTFGPLPSYTYGQYSSAHNRITINETLRGQDSAVLAATLIHEVFHAQEYQIRGHRPAATAADCLQEEVTAFRLEARWWYERFGRYGKRSTNRYDRVHNGLMRAWLNNGLRDWVLLSDSYQVQCLGGVVE
ncbi:MAG: hypothetical protein OXE05_04305 [Chloroflexi bacterium]|nr:hypothetical protein [Chloroflexota bacterium]